MLTVAKAALPSRTPPGHALNYFYMNLATGDFIIYDSMSSWVLHPFSPHGIFHIFTVSWNESSPVQ